MISLWIDHISKINLLENHYISIKSQNKNIKMCNCLPLFIEINDYPSPQGNLIVIGDQVTNSKRTFLLKQQPDDSNFK